MTKKRFLIPVVFGAWLAGCTQPPPETHAAGPEAAIAVQAVSAAPIDWPVACEATGTVRARATAAVSAKWMGYVREVRGQIGDLVKDGQVLVVLDAREWETASRRAEAGREEVRSVMPEADSAVAAAKSNVELAQVTFSRMQELFGKKSISNQEFDEASARLKAAQAAHDMARAKRTQLDAKLQQAEQEVRAAEIAYGYAEIAAPFAGIVTAKSVEPGTLALPGAPLLTLERGGSFRFEALVEESHLASIRLGQAVSIVVESMNRTFDGRVSEIVPVVDSTSRAGTVKIDLPAIPGLRSGVFGRAMFKLGSRRGLAIPAASVKDRGQLQSLMVVENGIARTRLVTLGQKDKERVEVLSGLNEGEKIVFPVPKDLADGARVEIRP